MTTPNDDMDQVAKAAEERVAEINALYRLMRSTLHFWLSQQDPPSADTSKDMLKKISEIQTAHLLVLKAEEAFHERNKSGKPEDAIVDLDEIRAEIGRKLDSLRDAIAKSGLSGKSDSG